MSGWRLSAFDRVFATFDLLTGFPDVKSAFQADQLALSAIDLKTVVIPTVVRRPSKRTISFDYDEIEVYLTVELI